MRLLLVVDVVDVTAIASAVRNFWCLNYKVWPKAFLLQLFFFLSSTSLGVCAAQPSANYISILLLLHVEK